MFSTVVLIGSFDIGQKSSCRHITHKDHDLNDSFKQSLETIQTSIRCQTADGQRGARGYSGIQQVK